MAQVKFYSVSNLPASPTDGGVYFVDGGELYKGASRFGANKVFTVASASDLASISGQIGGDLAIGFGAAKVWDPEFGTSGSWRDVGADNDAIKTTISSMISGLSKGTSEAGKYIEYIEQDGNGNVIAHAGTFPSGTATGNSGGIYVSVSYSSGGLNNTIYVSADDLEVSSITASTATFTDLTVTSTATFSVTDISASSLTVGGATIEQIADSRIASAKTNTVTSTGTSLPTESAVYSFVTGKIETLGNVMRFRNVVATLPSSSNKQGDIVVIAGVTDSESDVTNGQEYIWTSTTSTGTGYWELIGDQSAQEALLGNKAQIGNTGKVTTNGLGATVTLLSNSKPTLVWDNSGIANNASKFTASEYNDAFATTYAIKSYVDAQVSAANWNDSGSAYATGSSSGDPTITVAIDTSAAASKVTVTTANFGTAIAKNFTTSMTASGGNLPTEAAVATYVAGYVGGIVSSLDATVSSSAKGVFVQIVESNGVLTGATVNVAAASTMAFADTGSSTTLATTKAVADYFNENLVWLNASGSAITTP